MLQHNVTMMAPEDALKKEEQEYIDAKNKQDVAEKQVRILIEIDRESSLNHCMEAWKQGLEIGIFLKRDWGIR